MTEASSSFAEVLEENMFLIESGGFATEIKKSLKRIAETPTSVKLSEFDDFNILPMLYVYLAFNEVSKVRESLR